jgi:hypothetical protein
VVDDDEETSAPSLAGAAVANAVAAADVEATSAAANALRAGASSLLEKADVSHNLSSLQKAAQRGAAGGGKAKGD